MEVALLVMSSQRLRRGWVLEDLEELAEVAAIAVPLREPKW